MASQAYLTESRRIRIEQLLKEHNVPGVSVAVVHGNTIETQGYGLASLPEIPARSDTIWHIGSLTKAMTAAATGKLFDIPGQSADSPSETMTVLQRDRFRTRIQQVLPEFILENSTISSEATIEDALSHRTGMAGADKVYGDWMGQDPEALVKALRDLGPPTMPFRTGWQYNNFMYSVVGVILQQATGKSWGEVLQELLWKPLGMTSTFAYSSEVASAAEKERLARGYYFDDATGKVEAKFLEEPFLAFAGIGPAGSTLSTVEDLAKWTKALLTGAGGDSESLISTKLFQDLTTPRIHQLSDHTLSAPGRMNGYLSPKSYSLGWFNMPTTQGSKHPVLSHGGGLTGFGAMLYLLPNDDFGCVVLGNTTLSSNVVGEILCLEMMADKLDLYAHRRTDFIESLQLLSSDASLAASRLTQDQIRTDQVRIDSPRLVQQEHLPAEVSGIYRHPAYGAYRISRFADSTPAPKIVYGADLSLEVQKERSTSRVENPLLVVQPLGHRTWKEIYLLHLHSDTSEADSPDVVYFHLEQLLGKGRPSTEDEKSSEDPRTAPAAEFTSAKVWQSGAFSRNGAVLELRKGDGPQHRLGLRLGNAHLYSDGTGHRAGWSEMVWLTRELDN